jgi:hypothetical protein
MNDKQYAAWLAAFDALLASQGFKRDRDRPVFDRGAMATREPRIGAHSGKSHGSKAYSLTRDWPPCGLAPSEVRHLAVDTFMAETGINRPRGRFGD